MPLQYTFDEWYNFGVAQVASMSRNDKHHQEMLDELHIREAAYLDVSQSLDENQNEIIDAYICSLMNLEYQKTRLAYQLGKLVAEGIIQPKYRE